METVVFDVDVIAPSVRMLSLGHASDIAYTVVPESDFFDVYLQINDVIDVHEIKSQLSQIIQLINPIDSKFSFQTK